jgi:hypothetical protein
MAGRPEWRPGARVELRKPHACGGRTWVLMRLGADAGLKCETCGRRVMLTREEFEARARAVVSPAGNEGAAA